MVYQFPKGAVSCSTWTFINCIDRVLFNLKWTRRRRAWRVLQRRVRSTRTSRTRWRWRSPRRRTTRIPRTPHTSCTTRRSTDVRSTRRGSTGPPWSRWAAELCARPFPTFSPALNLTRKRTRTCRAEESPLHCSLLPPTLLFRPI